MLAALFLQATFTDVIDVLRVIIKTPAAIGISLWIGIVWRGWTPMAVWLSTISSVAMWAFVAYRPDLLDPWLPATMFNSQGNMMDVWQMVAYLSVGIISGIVVSMLTPRTPSEKLNHFFRLIHTPVRDGETIESPCTLPANPLPPVEKAFNYDDIELPKPTLIGFGGFVASWILVGLIVWLTGYLARVW